MPEIKQEVAHDQAIQVIAHFAYAELPSLEGWGQANPNHIKFAKHVMLNADAPSPLKIYKLNDTPEFEEVALQAVRTIYPVERDAPLS